MVIIWRASPEAVRTIRLGSYNICNSQNSGLESALQGMPQANMDLDVFQETNVNKGTYTRELVAYLFMESKAPIQNSVGVAVFDRKTEHITL